MEQIEKERQKQKIKPPKQYKVILLNDEYTTMEFVIEVLCTNFSLSKENAYQVMLQVHEEGKGVAGVYSKDIAESKVMQVTAIAQQEGHPLQLTVEPL